MIRTGTGARLPGPAAAALAAQVTVAGGSFLVQALAARELGAAGFGTFAILFGAVVMATAVSTGLVGDSLTVLDRGRPEVSNALWRVGGATIALAAATSTTVALLAGQPPSRAALFGAVVAAFMLADLCRRLLMAELLFWRLAAVDAVGAGVGVGTAWLWTLAADPAVEHFLLAVLASQLTTAALATVAAPAGHRPRPGPGWGDWRAVLAYGSWRAVQQFVRPTALNLVRWLVLLAAGQAAVGELEAARVIVAPAMLLVQGLGSYLFSSYAADRHHGAVVLLRRADRGAVVMLLGALVVGGIVALALPVLGELLTDGHYQLTALAVLGWSCYAASCAAVLPYGTLAAVGGQQRLVLAIRLLDSTASVALVGLVVWLLGAQAGWAPWLLSTGSFAGGWFLRSRVLLPQARRSAEDRLESPTVPAPRVGTP